MDKKLCKYLACAIKKINAIYIVITNYYYSKIFHKCGKNLRIDNGLVCNGWENIIIGDNFASMGYLQLYSNEGELIIGNNVKVNANVQINSSAGKISIGNDVLIAPNVVVRSSDHATNKHSIISEQKHNYGEINIEDDVWIGSNSVITSNVTLKQGTVIGAGAVVTKSTEPYSIVAGVPAKIIGYRQ